MKEVRGGISTTLAVITILLYSALLVIIQNSVAVNASFLSGYKSSSVGRSEHTAFSRDNSNTRRFSSTTDDNKDDGTTNNRVNILLCPAQFCVPADYESLFSTLRQYKPTTTTDESSSSTPPPVTIGTCRVAPLPRTEWIKVARQLPTKPFLTANLSCSITLDWYFDAIDRALADIYAEEGAGARICVVGHSIGGWVARAYLGGLASRSRSSSVYRLAVEGGGITSLVTLGSPHRSPEGALVDQTRGLLREVESTPECTSKSLTERNIQVSCVGSTAIPAKIITTNLEYFVAATSYLPLVGTIDSVRGDGIIPQELAFMDAPARRVEVDTCGVTGGDVRHAHVLPTPWNLWDGGAESIRLPEDFCWYGSKGVVGRWIDCIQ